jgi:hypothetical protein
MMGTKKLRNHIEQRAEKEYRGKNNDSKNMAYQHRPNMPTKVDVEHDLYGEQRQCKLPSDDSV